MKDQLIYELGEKGVTATFDPVTGLQGLIHKISEIPTETATITLTSNKNILSYYDSETATLTATHSQGAGKTVEIYNATTGTKIGDATDNNDGTYTYTYNSTGVGDISMTATSGTIESNSISITDYIYYDDASTNKVSNYSFISNPVSASISYEQNTNNYSVNYSRTPEANPVQILLCNFVQHNFELSIDIYYTTTGSSKQWTSRISDNSEGSDLWRNHSEVGTWSYSSIFRNTVAGTNSQSEGSTINTGKYYTFKFVRNNGSILIQQLNGDTIVKQYSSSEWSTSEVKWWLQISEYVGTFKFKNLKIKAL